MGVKNVMYIAIPGLCATLLLSDSQGWPAALALGALTSLLCFILDKGNN